MSEWRSGAVKFSLDCCPISARASSMLYKMGITGRKGSTEALKELCEEHTHSSLPHSLLH